MSFEYDFKLAFGDKYKHLHLKSVLVDRSTMSAIITFLYPSTCEELSAKDKQEIYDFISKNLNLEKLVLKIKFSRVFLEEKLISKAIISFLEEKFKLVSTYLKPSDFAIKITPIDVVVSVNLSSRLTAYFAEHKVSSELAKHLKDNFLVDFVIETVENPEKTDEVDLENVEMNATYKVTPRYQVEVVKEVFGKDFMLRPEFMNTIRSPKKNVTVAGFINKFERIDYVRKTGARAGQEAVRFSFTLQDAKGKLDAVYFSSKKNVRAVDALEDGMFVLAHGEVKLNHIGRLSLIVDKMALATVTDIGVLQNKPKIRTNKDGHVVEIEKLTTLEQDTMFAPAVKYNSKIMNNTIVVFDIETTGLDEQSCEIIEIGAVKIENGVILEKFSTLVRPEEEISEEITALTGITNEMVENAPTIDYVIRDFYDFTRGCTLCGHNAIGFDMKFIKRDGETYDYDFDNPVIDTMNEARNAKLNISRYNLAAVLKALGLTNEGAHRAWNDAYATAQALLKMNEMA